MMNMNWISVKEKLPHELEANVLVVYADGFFCFAHVEKRKKYVYWVANDDDAPFFEVRFGDEARHAITHWLPLVEPT
jgi:hypothetical protein